jgi:ornithine cyclodeaminase
MRVLTADYLSGLVDPSGFDHYLENALRSHDPNRIIQPQRTVVRLGDNAVWLIMPVVDLAGDRIVVKMVSEYKDNPARGLPKASGLTQLVEASTGRLLALFDSHFITGLRTSSAAGIATKLLSREDSECLGVIGSGYEAGLIVDAVLRVRPKIKRIHVYSRSHEKRTSFASRYAGRYEAHALSDPNSVAASSDILVTATDSSTPVLSGSSLKEGAHVVSIGTLPDRRELDRDTFKRCTLLVADNKEAVLREAGDVLDAVRVGLIKEQDVVDLVDLLRGKHVVQRAPHHVTIYKAVGFGYLDVAAAQYLYERLAQAGGH